jgi:hypothetical protein
VLRGRRLTSLLAIGFLGSCLVSIEAVSVVSAGADTTVTINFDNGQVGDGQAITTQYQGEGVFFAQAADYGFRYGGAPSVGTNFVSPNACNGTGEYPVLFAAGNLTSSPPDAARLAACNGSEFWNNGTFGLFTSGADQVSAEVGELAGSGSQFELDAYDQSHDLIGSATITTTTVGIVNLLSYTPPAGTQIWAFAIYTTDQSDHSDFGMDDLSYSIAVGQQPQIALSASAFRFSGILGSTGSIAVTLERDNGSTGEVDLALSGLPAGVTATFSPAALLGTATASTLNWTISPQAVLGYTAATITATPAVPAAGATAAEPFALGVSVVAAYSWADSDLGSVVLANCQSVQVTDSGQFPIFQPPSGISGTGAFSVQGAGAGTGVGTASFSPATFSNGSASPTLTLSTTATTPVKNDALTVSAAVPGYTTEDATLTVTRIPGQVLSWYPLGDPGDFDAADVTTPQWGAGGETLVINGSGFCPGAQVAFGEFGSPPAITAATPALVTPSYISPDGLTMRVTVPQNAANGPINVFTTAGSFAGSASLDVGTYSAVNGYSFGNRSGPGIDLADLAAVFPQSEVYVQVDPCSWITGGLVSCSVASTGIGSPQADIFFAGGGGSLAQGGECYGFSLSSVLLQQLAGAPVSPEPQELDANAHDVNEITDNSAVDSEILSDQISQDSSQTDQLAAGEEFNAEQDSAAQFESQLRTALQPPSGNPGPVLVNLHGTVNGSYSGHSVVAYDVEDTANGGFDIYVYNPNDPYNSSVSGDSTGSTNAWIGSQANSVIHVQGNGSWTFPELGYAGTLGTGNLYMIPYRDLPTSYDLPWSFLFGNILASAPSSTELDQVTDSAGHTLLTAAGQLNRSPSGISSASLVYNITGGSEPAAPRAILPEGRSYSLTLSPRQGTVEASIIGSTASASVSGATTSKVRFGLDSSSDMLSLYVGSTAGAFTANLAQTSAKGADRTATLTLARGSTGTLTAQLTTAGTLQLADASGSAKLAVELGSSGPSSLPGAVATSSLQLSKGAMLILRPTSWAALSSSPLTLHSVSPGGRTTVTRLRDMLSGPRLDPLRLAVAQGHGAVSVTLHGAVAGTAAPRLFGAAAGRTSSSATINWTILRGKHVVHAYIETLATVKLSSRSFGWTVKGLRKGNYVIVVGVLVSTSISGSEGAVTAARTARTSLSVS